MIEFRGDLSLLVSWSNQKCPNRTPKLRDFNWIISFNAFSFIFNFSWWRCCTRSVNCRSRNYSRRWDAISIEKSRRLSRQWSRLPIAKGCELWIRANFAGFEDLPKGKYTLRSAQLISEFDWTGQRTLIKSNWKHCVDFVYFCHFFGFKVTVTVKWQLKDVKSNKVIICVLIPARIE